MSNHTEGIDEVLQGTLKGRYPFRLGTTSFIYPAGWAENVARLAPIVDEVELLFFESQVPGSLPDGAEIARLAETAANHDITYTVHLPVDVDLSAMVPADRKTAVDALADIYTRTRHLPVTSYTLHLAYPAGTAREAGEIGRWQERTRAGVEALLAAGVAPRRLSIETLDYPFAWVAPIVENLALRVCLDIGHLILYAQEPWDGGGLSEALERYLALTTVIHLHGVAAGRDHRPLDELDGTLVDLVLERLWRARYRASLSLEVFGQEALERSLARFQGAWEKISTP
jgi:sugar phosphate isomerase/epimerase